MTTGTSILDFNFGFLRLQFVIFNKFGIMASNMKSRNFHLLVGSLSLLIVVVHLLRIIFRWSAVIGGWEIPFWFGWVPVLIFGYLAYLSFKLLK